MTMTSTRICFHPWSRSRALPAGPPPRTIPCPAAGPMATPRRPARRPTAAG